ncbi:MAG TPA: hypothetical protein VIJ39_10415 [Solirubrobacteraceae bacterium]
MRIRALGVTYCVASSIIVLGMSAPMVANASEGQAFGITQFKLEPTETVETQETSNNETIHVFQNYPAPFTQAGGHPNALTATIEFASEEREEFGSDHQTLIDPTRDPKDVIVDLPPGLLGDPVAVPRCPLAVAVSGSEKCPPSTQLGFYRLKWLGGHEALGPIVNVVPEAGQTAEFVLETAANVSFIETAHLVRTEAGYGFDVESNNIPASQNLVGVEETFWGVPGAKSHDAMRGLECSTSSHGNTALFSGCVFDRGGEPSVPPEVPFLTMSTDCATGPEPAYIRADSWEEPGEVDANGHYEGYEETKTTLPQVTGCNLVQFLSGTEIKVRPETVTADEPTGVSVNLVVPQVETPETLAAPQLSETKVTLPEGMSISPGAVDGIQACEEFGPEGINITGRESEEIGANGELQLAPGHCPAASTVGTAKAITPDLASPVEGHVYLARPGCGGVSQAACTEQDALDGNIYKLYLELGGTGEFADAGIQFKVPFDVEANPATGQLTTVVQKIVQAPVSEVKINLNGGPRASVDNSAVCGPAVTTADFTPWSAPGTTPEGIFVAGTPDAGPSSYFNVEGCANPQPFAPGLVAGTVTPQAGQFSSFTLNLSRKDREQYVKGIQVHTPPGLLGILANVPLCAEPQADQGTCPEASKIGSTRVASGAGSHPFEIEGAVYLTGPHDGAPFGLSIVTHAVAGPFNLGLVIVRARINVDPENSTLTVTTDETGPYALPQIIFGVPLRLQRVTVDIDRPNFMFNPTNCSGQQITAAISGSQDTVTNVSSPFAVAGCKSLAFKPAFKVSTSGNTSRAKGASLDAKLSYPKGALGNDANIARVKVDLPKQLPSRLSTLQKACVAATFNTNPADCPKESIVGVVRASTPLLPVGLAGPVYFVSHGGESFPSLIVVLQGDGVRVDLTGTTFINEKTNITSSTFKTVPDVPVNTFELYLPEGKYSALAAIGSLCKSTTKLKMPTEFVAQNGAVVKQNTQITVTGCPKNKADNTQKTRKAKQSKRPKHNASTATVENNTSTNRRAG